MILAGCAPQDSTPEEGGDTGQTAPEGDDDVASEPGEAADDAEEAGPVTDFTLTEHDQFDSPWALEFLPGSDLLLITERTGAMVLRDQETGDTTEISGVPEVDDAGQGGLHDVIATPEFEQDHTIYLSWVRQTDDGRQGVVGRAELDTDGASLGDVEVIWEQDAATGDGHYALRLLAHDDHLYVTSGDRQELDPAQDMSTNLGTIVRLTPDGEPAPGNPFENEGGVAEQFWTTGHRNPLGIAVDSSGNIWNSEMGPQDGDELNLLTEGANYGWPEASMGVHYDGTDIPDHAEDDGFEPPAEYWVPAISPGSLLIYSGELFTGWTDSALLGGLSGQNLVRVELDGSSAEQVDDWDMGDRVRALAEAPDGAIWIATDSGELWELRPE